MIYVKDVMKYTYSDTVSAWSLGTSLPEAGEVGESIHVVGYTTEGWNAWNGKVLQHLVAPVGPRSHEAPPWTLLSYYTL